MNDKSIRGAPDQTSTDSRRRTILEEGNRAYSRLRVNPKAWVDELKERAAWEGTLGDGLQERPADVPPEPLD